MPGEQKDTALRAVVWTWATNRIGWLDLKDNEPFKSHGGGCHVFFLFRFFSTFCTLRLYILQTTIVWHWDLRELLSICQVSAKRLRCSTRVLWASWLPDDQGQSRRLTWGSEMSVRGFFLKTKLQHSGRAWFLCWGWEAYALISAVSRLCTCESLCAQKHLLFRSVSVI